MQQNVASANNRAIAAAHCSASKAEGIALPQTFHGIVDAAAGHDGKLYLIDGSDAIAVVETVGHKNAITVRKISDRARQSTPLRVRSVQALGRDTVLLYDRDRQSALITVVPTGSIVSRTQIGSDAVGRFPVWVGRTATGKYAGIFEGRFLARTASRAVETATLQWVDEDGWIRTDAALVFAASAMHVSVENHRMTVSADENGWHMSAKVLFDGNVFLKGTESGDAYRFDGNGALMPAAHGAYNSRVVPDGIAWLRSKSNDLYRRASGREPAEELYVPLRAIAEGSAAGIWVDVIHGPLRTHRWVALDASGVPYAALDAPANAALLAIVGRRAYSVTRAGGRTVVNWCDLTTAHGTASSVAGTTHQESAER